ncbi:hypothetical protein WA158_005158 [Blastocystis sp. Blastoise]
MCTCWVFSYKTDFTKDTGLYLSIHVNDNYTITGIVLDFFEERGIYKNIYRVYLDGYTQVDIYGLEDIQVDIVEPFPYLERHLDASLVLTNTSHDKNLLIYYHQDKQIYTIIDLSYSPISDKYTYSLIRNSDNRAFIFDLPQGSYTILKEIPARDRLVTPLNPPPTDPILSTELKSFVEEYTDKRYYCKPYSSLYKAIETSLYEYMNVLQSLWADIDFGKDFEYLFSILLKFLPSDFPRQIDVDEYTNTLKIAEKRKISSIKNKIDGITNLTTLFNDLQTIKKSAIYKSLVQYIRDRDILDVLFRQCLNTETLRLSLSLLQYICTVIPLTNKDIDIFYEAVHNNRIYESIQATTIICQLLPLFPNQQREYLQSLLLNTSVDICTEQSIKVLSKLLVLYINDIPESQPIPDSIRNSIKTVGELFSVKDAFVLPNQMKKSTYIPQDMIYTLLTRIEEIIQNNSLSFFLYTSSVTYIKKIDIYSISFNMSHNSLEEVYSPPFPPPPPTNYFTGAYKDTGTDLMDDDDMEVPEEKEIGLMNTYEKKERGEGVKEIYSRTDLWIKSYTEYAIDVQYVYSLLRNRLKTTNKEEKYDVNILDNFIYESLYQLLTSHDYLIKYTGYT